MPMSDSHCLHRPAHAFRNCSRTLDIGFRQYDHKLLAPKACEQIRGPLEFTLHASRHSLETLIAHLVTVAIIELLEVIDICNQKTERTTGANSPPPFAQEGFVEFATVGDTGQTIHRGQPPQLAIGIVKLAGKDQQRIAHLRNTLHCPHLCTENSLGDRLCQVIITTDFDTSLQILVRRASSQENDRRPFAVALELTNASGHFESIHARHDDVKEDEIRPAGLEGLNAKAAVLGVRWLQTHLAQLVAYKRGTGDGVFDYERFHGSGCMRGRTGP